MSVNTLKGLNAAFRNDMIDAGAASYLLLPASRAEQFRNALLVQPSMGLAAPQGQGTAAITAVAVPSKTTTPRKTHTVRRGDSLWQIARNYSVNVSELQRWNHLRGQTLKLGQVLRVSDTN